MRYDYYIGDANQLLFKTNQEKTWAMLVSRDDMSWTIFSDYGFGMGYIRRRLIPDLYVILKGKTP